MYHRHFGFKERPFRLVPDPAYLFMGRTHQEAMAHLRYAVDAGDGFAAITGEVGTGKTTLCRAFMESLDADVTSAYIFNPASDPIDLIRAINRDLGLAVETEDLQDLVEALNRFLIEEKGSGRSVILVIDEAQNLGRRVLEQIRLLSNLETTRNKLLQIILVGQPELRQTLAAASLRQLRQRISLNCRLSPLSLAETGAYIRHRLSVASEGTPVRFTPAAIRAVFRFSGGIPRLINTACDRALLTAYGRGYRKVTAPVARSAVAELLEAGAGPRPGSRVRGLLAAGLVLTMVAAAMSVGLNRAGTWFADPLTVQPRKTKRYALTHPSQAPPPESAPREAPPPKTPGPTEADAIDPSPPEEQTDPWAMDRGRAVGILADRWGVSAAEPNAGPEDDAAFFQGCAKTLGMSVYRLTDRPDLVDRLDLPAILPLSGTGPARPGYGVLVGIQAGLFLLADPVTPQAGHAVSPAELKKRWTGTAHIFWKDFYSLAGEIPRQATGETILTLKLLLREIGYNQVGLSAVFDGATRRAVMDFQARRGLPRDGVVGSLTKIVLYNTRPGLGIPKLHAPFAVSRGETS